MAHRPLLSRLRHAPAPLLRHGELGAVFTLALRPFSSPPPAAAAAAAANESPPPTRQRSSRLFVAGLSWSADERSLTDAFSSFGAVTEDGAHGTCSTKLLRGPGGRWARAQRELYAEESQVVSFSTAIQQHARSGLFGDAVGLFLDMTRAGVCPNSFTLVGLSIAAAGLGDTVLAECIHGWTVKSLLESNPFVRTALLDSYAKCGHPMKAWTLFSGMTDPGIVTWNAMISGLVQNGLFEEALSVFKRWFCLFGPIHNAITMISIAQACAGCGDLGLSESAHAYAVKMGLDLDVMATNSILGMYLSSVGLDIAREVFKKIVDKNVVTCTMMMGFLLEKAHAGEVINVFVQMRSIGIVPDRVAMVSLVQACALLGDGRRGKLVHNQIVMHGFIRELPAVNSLITMYSRCKDLSSARMLFDSLRDKDKSQVSWTAMVSGYVENGSIQEGMHLIAMMRHEGFFVIDYVTMATLLLSCYETAKFDLCVQLHGYGYKSGLYLHRPVLNTLMAVYGKCGYASLAHRVFDQMISRDVVSWNTMILSYGVNGQGKEAVALFNEMEKYGEDRDSVTYLNTLLACSHSGLVDHGLIIFGRMINEKGINPCREHIGCIVDMLSRSGRLDEAAEMANLTHNKMGPNAWKALMAGSHLHFDMKFTQVAADKVLRTQSFDHGHVVLLCNTYASFGKYSDAESVRSCYTKRTAHKTKGLSSIEVITLPAQDSRTVLP